MDWQIKTIADKSAASEREFEPGDVVVCLLFKDAESKEIARADILESEASGYEPGGELLGRWQRVVKAPDEEGATVEERMASAEDLFCSLYENPGADDDGDAAALKHLLALFLERKRILKVKGRRNREGVQVYYHPKREADFEVPIVEITPEFMTRIEHNLSDLVL